MRGHYSAVDAVLLMDHGLLVTGSRDRSIALWNVTQMEEDGNKSVLRGADHSGFYILLSSGGDSTGFVKFIIYRNGSYHIITYPIRFISQNII